MFSILLATGYEKLDNTLTKLYDNDQNVSLLSQRVYFREGLSDTIDRLNPDLILMSEHLDGNTLSIEQTVRLVRKHHPDKRIIFIMLQNDNSTLRKFLYQLSIYDVFTLEPKLDLKELYQSFLQSKEWKDVVDRFPELSDESFSIDEDFILNDNTTEEEEDTYYPLSIKLKNNTLTDSLRTSAAFWSTRDQSGSTFLAVNTALLFSQDPNKKVLLVDSNINNPNIHLQLTLNSDNPNQNLSALCEDIENKSIHKLADIGNYLIEHPTFSNLHILQGNILKAKKPAQQTIIKTIQSVIKYADQENYSIVLFDLDSGLEEEYIISTLKTVDKIITPITENPGSIIGVQKMFDREYGSFFLSFLDLKKVFPVLNKSTQSNNEQKTLHILQSILQKRIEITIPQNKLIFDSIYSGNPILKSKCPAELLRSLSITANFIHNVFSIGPEPKKKPEKKRFGLF